MAVSRLRWTARSNNLRLAPLDILTVGSTPAAATQATVTAPAAAGLRWVCRRLVGTITPAAATVIDPVNLEIRDGAGGTILFSAVAAAIANTKVVLDFDYLELPGSTNTAMVLQFAAAGPAGSLETVQATLYLLDT